MVKYTQELFAKSVWTTGEDRDYCKDYFTSVKCRLGMALQKKEPLEWALQGAGYFSRCRGELEVLCTMGKVHVKP